MAGLQRFITYIYRYENDEKMENTGFAKIEIRGSVCRIEIHIHNINMEEPETTVYLFARKAEIMYGIPVGNLNISRGNGDVRYSFDTKDLIKFDTTIKDLEGLWIPLSKECYLASQWKEGTIKKELFHKKEEIEEKKETKEVIEIPEEPEEETSEISQSTEANSSVELKQEQADVSQNTQETKKDSKQPIQATELPLEEFFDSHGWEGIFRKLRLKLDIFYPFEGEEIECVRMQLKDLRELPQKYWYIGNNSFLLHGFFNYRHLIFGELSEDETKKYFIGVPGVFQNQERIMASMFGFPEFRTAKTTEYMTGNFGYWYRLI